MSYSESIAIQPTSGGDAPLYSPRTPSLRTVCSTQSSGPRKCVVSEVCRRTLTVSKLRGLSAVQNAGPGTGIAHGWPTVNENVSTAFSRSVALHRELTTQLGDPREDACDETLVCAGRWCYPFLDGRHRGVDTMFDNRCISGGGHHRRWRVEDGVQHGGELSGLRGQW